jgi:two-component system sensor histidine kinase KdpD
VVCTVIGTMMFRHFELSNIIMVYLLGVVAISARFGRGPAIFSSIASVAAFDFFFVPPYLTFVVADAQYLITFAVMLVVGIIISALTVEIQNYARSALLREHRTAALYAMSRQLASARGTRKLLEIATAHVAEVFDASVVAMTPDQDGRLIAEAGNVTTFPLTGRERGVAQWVFDLGRIAGMGTDTLPGAEAIYVPLNATRGALGVFGVHPNKAGRTLSMEQLHLLEAFASQAALAIESDRFADEAQNAKLNADIEKSRSALLSSVSHDLRTPLAAICGAASSLREDKDRLDSKAKDELLDSINDEANRLARLVSNLLEMTKLEAGAHVNKEMCPVEEVIGSALGRIENTLKDHPVKTSLPSDLPLIPMDVLLMEQVFLNLLENATKYTAAGAGIDISASVNGASIKIEVADHGPGIVPGDEKRIFEKFYRSNGQTTVSGAGLGLAISRAIVEAHGGVISAENRTGGGAVFRLSLPLADPSTLKKSVSQ